MANCIRCGSEKQIEKHRIIPGIEGGKYTPENTEERCMPCHKYEHAKRKILEAMEGETQKNRLDILNSRLETLEKYNTPELIRERGNFQSYSIRPELTYPLPRRRRKSNREIKRELQPELLKE